MSPTHRRDEDGFASMLTRLTNYPLVFFAISLIVLWSASTLGARLSNRVGEIRDDVKFVATATFTLLSLLIGFAFSMAVGRYDQRKGTEAEEANVIGTEYLRLDLLPTAGRDTLRRQLEEYLSSRIVFYETQNSDSLTRNLTETRRLQQLLWTTTTAHANPPSANTSLVLAGMNAVLDSEGYTTAAWLNRIPRSAWILLFAIALCACFFVGLTRERPGSKRAPDWIFPAVVSVAFLLIADIDAPRRGLIHVLPDNLITVAESMRS